MTPVPLNTGDAALHPGDNSKPARSFRVTFSLKVRDTFTWFAMFASLVNELAVNDGFAVLIETDRAGEAEEVTEFMF